MKILLFLGKLIAIHTFLMFAFIPSSQAEFATFVTCRIPHRHVSVRSCGSTRCERLFRLNSNEPVNVIDRSGNWRKVNTSYGVGWIYKKYLCYNE